MNDFRGYGLFNDVENRVLKAWNRAQVFFNIKEQHGKELAEEYLSCFDKKERLHLFVMFKSIAVKGLEATRVEVQKEVHEI